MTSSSRRLPLSSIGRSEHFQVVFELLERVAEFRQRQKTTHDAGEKRLGIDRFVRPKGKGYTEPLIDLSDMRRVLSGQTPVEDSLVSVCRQEVAGFALRLPQLRARRQPLRITDRTEQPLNHLDVGDRLRSHDEEQVKVGVVKPALSGTAEGPLLLLATSLELT
jgi:hypothetical protein